MGHNSVKKSFLHLVLSAVNVGAKSTPQFKGVEYRRLRDVRVDKCNAYAYHGAIWVHNTIKELIVFINL